MKLGQPPRATRPSSPVKRFGSLLAFVAAMALLGFLAQFQWMGYIAILVYAVVGFIKRIPARTTFFMALLTLGVVPIAIIFSNRLVAQNFAAYTFALLVLGVIVTTIELQKAPQAEP